MFQDDRNHEEERLSSTVKFPELFKHWLDCDVNYFDDRLFRGLTPADLYLYWAALERNYLERYKRFLRLEYEFGASGFVGIKYPGALGISPCMSHTEEFYLPPSLDREIWEWCELVDYQVLHTCTEDENHREYAWGLSIARKIARYVPEDVYFEYLPLQQIGIRDGEGVVLGCAREINDILRLYPGNMLYMQRRRYRIIRHRK